MADESYVSEDAVISASDAKWVRQKIQHNMELLDHWNKYVKVEIEKRKKVWDEKYSKCQDLLELADMVLNEELDLKSSEKMNKELKDRVVELEKMLADKSRMEWHAIAGVATIAAVVFYLRRN